jgi:hypothetical protein
LSARRQTLREILLPSDRRNVGRISPSNFSRALDATSTNDKIARAYQIGEEVDYFRLPNDLKSVQSSLPTPGFSALATLIKTRGVDGRAGFSQKDSLNTGKQPKVQFHSVLYFFDSKPSPRAIQEISAPFRESNCQSNYFLFQQALDTFVVPSPRVPRTSDKIRTICFGRRRRRSTRGGSTSTYTLLRWSMKTRAI